MATVREASFDLFRELGMTTMFGNPGSTELPMLADFPSDFRYVLGLQEAVVVGMADGYAQASGRTTMANLHTAPGVGNAMGAIFNAQANHPRTPPPLVRGALGPARAEDVPLALAHGAHLAGLPPKGPTFVSLPMDDWYAQVRAGAPAEGLPRAAGGRAAADPAAVRALADRLDAATNPVMVAGPDIDASGAWDLAIA